jgi:hypothetical protein
MLVIFALTRLTTWRNTKQDTYGTMTIIPNHRETDEIIFQVCLLIFIVIY